MKKTLRVFIVALLCMVMLSGCFCQHDWMDANCTAAKTCRNCGETEGEALGHSWQEATCAAPRTCTACGHTEGACLPHTWEDATCSMPKTCKECALTEGEALGHVWEGCANFQEPDICTVCGAEGEKTMPYFEEVGLTVNIQEGVECDYISCNYKEEEAIGKLTVSNYRIFTSDDKHRAKEGYEWRAADIDITYDTSISHSSGAVYFVRADYYIFSGYNIPGEFTVHYLGEERTDCVCSIENDDFIIENGIVTGFHGEVYFQVPIGYDGVSLAFYNPIYDVPEYLHEFEDPHLLIFRFD